MKDRDTNHSEDTAGTPDSSIRTGFGMMIICIVSVAGLYLSRPLYDPDFYWHLKTGQWIWQHAALPHTDPFGVPPLPEPSYRTEFILTSYWLIQMILYGFYAVFGTTGIILYRWLIAGIVSVVLCGWADVRNRHVAAVIAIGSILLLEYYFIERPQFVSFVCFGILLVTLFRYVGQSGSRAISDILVPLSLIMLIWSNMHGGFLIGQAILIFFVTAEGVKFFHPSLYSLPANDYKKLLVSVVIALMASFVNPNAFNLLGYLPVIFDSGNYANQGVLEELSLLEYARATGDYTAYVYFVAAMLTAVAFVMSGHRKNITWVGLLAGTAFMGYQHMRLTPFFLVAALLFMARYAETGFTTLKARVVLMAMIAVTTIICLRDEFSHVSQSIRSGWIPANQYPVKSADFISLRKVSGNIFTTMPWGGYMIWRAGPGNRIFHDGRILSLQRAWEYYNSTAIMVNGTPYWKGLFNTYKIDAAVLPLFDGNGTPEALAQMISNDGEWSMAFSAENEAVFVRKASGERDRSNFKMPPDVTGHKP